MSAPRTLRVKCASWDQVESFYLRKLRRGRSVTIRVPFVPHVGDAIAVGLELPNDLVVVVDGTITGVHPSGDDRAAIDIELHGLSPDLVDRLETLVADGRAAASEPDTTEEPAAPPPRRPDDPAHALVVQLDAELRRLRQLAVHEVLGVPWDASAVEVRTAWRQLCQRFHPDVLASHGSAAVAHLGEELMILVNRAYDRMRASLVAEGRAAALGPALRPEKGWLVAFDAISTGEVTPSPVGAVVANEPPPPPEARRRKAPTTGQPSVRFEKTTETVFDDLAASDSASLDAARAAATDNVFEKQARARLSAGDHRAAREVLAAALYVYPKNQVLRALYHVSSAMGALDDGQHEHASAQLEAALSADPGCREARDALDELRRRRDARAR
jgi:hypothetical protein